MCSVWSERATYVVGRNLMVALSIVGLFGPALAETPTRQPAQPAPSVRFAPPEVADIPHDEHGKQILFGRRLLAETRKLLPDHVGDALNCVSCHLNDGTVAGALPYVGVSVNYPRYNPRAGRSMTLEDRINGCFQRSMNGRALADDSPEIIAMVAYMDWLSAGLPQHAKVEGAGIGKIDTSLVPDPLRGKEIYAAKCAVCHGADGQGQRDAGNEFVVPPLWGDQSFNIGAGMARTYTAAAFVKRNMPLGQGGTLSDQEAVDVAGYFTHQPRPDFAAKVDDWPNGGKPKDARY